MSPQPSSETQHKIAKMEIERESPRPWYLGLASAFLYAACSTVITTVNKVVLTTYKFPSHQVLGIGQMSATVLALFMAKQLNVVTFPQLSLDIPKRLFPLPLFYLGNLWFGLGGTKSVSLPMFTALRRFSIWMTMVAQYYILGMKITKREQIAVYGMVIGAIIAASDDLSFDAMGYLFLTMNNVFTAANNVYIKKKMDAKDLGKYGVMFYNSLFMLLPLITIAFSMGELEKAARYPRWNDVWFVFQFLLSCVMGFVLIWTTYLCTAYNGPLTTCVIGCLKNILITYLGMFIGGDYVFSITNFIGLNLSIAASLYYTYATLSKPSPAAPELVVVTLDRGAGDKKESVSLLNGSDSLPR